MGRGIENPGGKRTCGVLKKDLRKRRKIAAQTRFLHKESSSNSFLTASAVRARSTPTPPMSASNQGVLRFLAVRLHAAENGLTRVRNRPICPEIAPICL